MLPFDRRPWAKPLARLVIAVTVVAVLAYAILIMRHRSLDAGERFILALLLIAVIPPNIAIIRRKPGAVVEPVQGFKPPLHGGRVGR